MKRSEIKTLHDLFEYYNGIPPSRWCTGNYTDPLNSRCHCALGHLGVDGPNAGETERNNPLIRKVIKIWRDNLNRSVVEDNDGKSESPMKTPKLRILNSLIHLMYDVLEPDYRLVA